VDVHLIVLMSHLLLYFSQKGPTTTTSFSTSFQHLHFQTSQRYYKIPKKEITIFRYFCSMFNGCIYVCI